ncbi:MAG TPA: FAD-dependent oxidoreductase [Silvibacterium sp.]|nr:FAD-dependent oxidoreductase [Silvibacterium sp.]
MAMKLKLKERRMVAKGTMSFHFEKPAGFAYVAGQAGDWILQHPAKTDKEGEKRSFTLASAPYEDDLFFTTRLRETAFKENLQSMPLGSEMDFDGPWGELTLHEDTAVPAVFLTGGIGVTPFRSIVLQWAHDRLEHSVFLFYSNRRPEDAAFMDEMQAIAKQRAKFTFVPTMTEMDKSKMPWSGAQGYIDEPMLRKSIADLNRPIYYLSGPPKMVEAMQKLLKGSGVNQDRVRTETFDGY